jgi:hypothetical protein
MLFATSSLLPSSGGYHLSAFSRTLLVPEGCGGEKWPAEWPFTYGKTRRRLRWVFQHHQGEWARYVRKIRLSRTLVAGCRGCWLAAGRGVHGEYEARCEAQEASLL